jgi:hypothetical protein
MTDPAITIAVTAAERKADRRRRYKVRRRNGVVVIATEHQALWLAEALWQGGFIAI